MYQLGCKIIDSESILNYSGKGGGLKAVTIQNLYLLLILYVICLPQPITYLFPKTMKNLKNSALISE